MAMQLSHKDLVAKAAQVDRLKAGMNKIKGEAQKHVGTILRSTVVSGSSFFFGGLEGRFGGVELVGVPLSLIAASLAHGLGFMGIGGDLTHAFGDGAFGSYANNLGFSTGRTMAIKADEFNPKTGLRKGQPGFAPLSGDEKRAIGLISGETGSRGMTGAENAAMARNA